MRTADTSPRIPFDLTPFEPLALITWVAVCPFLLIAIGFYEWQRKGTSSELVALLRLLTEAPSPETITNGEFGLPNGAQPGSFPYALSYG